MTQKKCTIAQNSQTYAIKAQQLLLEIGVESDIVRLTEKQSKNGCTYGLELDCKSVSKALDRLKSAGLNARSV